MKSGCSDAYAPKFVMMASTFHVRTKSQEQNKIGLIRSGGGGGCTGVCGAHGLIRVYVYITVYVFISDKGIRFVSLDGHIIAIKSDCL